jgi:hypothetical protein
LADADLGHLVGKPDSRDLVGESVGNGGCSNLPIDFLADHHGVHAVDFEVESKCAYRGASDISEFGLVERRLGLRLGLVFGRSGGLGENR